MVRRYESLGLTIFMMLLVVSPHFTAEPSTADESIQKDRTQRHILKYKKNVAATPKLGFFGTVFHLILEQVNDTKSAYNQISELVGGQFADENAVTTESDPNSNVTETPKLTRSDFLKILDRNLKGLARLRSLEAREAKKDSMANLRRYKEEIFGGKKSNLNR